MINSLPPWNLHRATRRWVGDADSETDAFIADMLQVWNSLHQGMPIIGTWMEQRLSHLIRGWPDGWTTSGPSQVYRLERPEVRSRSWDIVVHRAEVQGAPPEAAPGIGYPLLPASMVPDRDRHQDELQRRRELRIEDAFQSGK